MKTINIAIDGPSGAGKSSISKAVAADLGFIHVDTGAMYRAIGLYALRHACTEPDAITAQIDKVDVELKFIAGAQRVMLCGEDVSDYIRSPEVSMAASAVAAVPAVRERMLDLQKKIASENNIIMDGRDIGTVVLPDAQVKIFLTASPEARAGRRYKELIEKGMDVKYEDILQDVITRDYNDSHRETAPLKPAEGCVTVDTTELDFEQSVAKIISVIKENI